MNPEYPIYILSKGRWERRMTAKSLDYMKVDYKIVVEPQEYAQYTAVIDAKKIIQLPFENYNQGQGGIPARNFIWEHAKATGAKRHWILDDNISHFYRFTGNKHIPVDSGTIFRAAEVFCDRYENVAMAGLNYRWLSKAIQAIPPFYLNTRCYSCILLQNDLPFRWRGRYNEDTDLSLNILKAGLCTVLFNAFLCGKASTMQMKGGNTDELYKDDGRLKMAESLKEQHPYVVTVVQKFNRWQHHVDYRPFVKNRLKRRDGVVIPDGVNNFGMTLRDARPGE